MVAESISSAIKDNFIRNYLPSNTMLFLTHGEFKSGIRLSLHNINFAAIWCTRATVALWIARKLRFDWLATGFQKAKLGPHPFHDTGFLGKTEIHVPSRGAAQAVAPRGSERAERIRRVGRGVEPLLQRANAGRTSRMGADLVRGVVIRGAGERIVPSTRGRESAARAQIDDTGCLPAVEHTVDGAMQGAPTRKAVDRGDIGAGSSQGSSPPHMLSYNTGDSSIRTTRYAAGITRSWLPGIDLRSG